MTLKAVQAEAGDFDFMRKELILGARKRHFNFPVLDPAGLRSLEDNIRSAIEHHRFCSGLLAVPILFMHKQSRVGMVIMTEVSPGQGGNEIHIVFVTDKHRGKGYGSQMVDSILASRQGVDVYARCAPASQRMYEMLQRRGFVYLHTMQDGQRILVRPKQQLFSASQAG